MNATILPEKKKHYPVLLNEIISIITPQYGGTFIDCTFGQGGYTKKILEYPKSKVIALDRDEKSKIISSNIKKEFKNRFFFKNKKFSQINDLELKKETVKSIIFDLGCSYTQIKDPQKGLSFNSVGDLNMKMGLNDFSAKEAIHKLDQKDLEKIFKYFGDEKDSKRIAYKIIKNREIKKINTQDLVKIIESSKRKKNFKIHSATKVFQALRIFVNKEISELIYGLINATKIIKPGGIIIVVTFHSLEDKIVKFFFKSLSEKKSISRYMPKINEKDNLFKSTNKKPIVPTNEEIKKNPPSRSAKLRFAIKDKNILNFEKEILEKFNYLLETENLSEKI
jgi:16S rRNA (cytosine1402-N4)-methyltransferase|tara:strand:- start:4027 stop:5037 length:1011 start_codon:yes stop_codon:yes gene_type:complete